MSEKLRPNHPDYEVASVTTYKAQRDNFNKSFAGYLGIKPPRDSVLAAISDLAAFHEAQVRYQSGEISEEEAAQLSSLFESRRFSEPNDQRAYENVRRFFAKGILPGLRKAEEKIVIDRYANTEETPSEREIEVEAYANVVGHLKDHEAYYKTRYPEFHREQK